MYRRRGKESHAGLFFLCFVIATLVLLSIFSSRDDGRAAASEGNRTAVATMIDH